MESTAYTGSTRWDELVVNRIAINEPLQWLSKGWQDMRDAGRYSLAYGAAIVLISALITYLLYVTESQFLLPFLVAGFFLIAPFLGIGLYQMSAHLERGESLKTCNAVEAWKRKPYPYQYDHRWIFDHHAALDSIQLCAFLTAL